MARISTTIIRVKSVCQLRKGWQTELSLTINRGKGGGEMGKIICRKCGATGHSKCPACRTVFNDNQSEAILSHFLKYEEEGGNVKVHFTLNDATVEEALRSLKSWLMDPNFDPAQYACTHHWEFAEGHGSDIGCKCLG